MEQEKNEFFAKRDQDIKRIKSEAYELDLKTQQVQIAEQHVAELKSANESKFRQLQHLEQLLTSECSEIERMRNEMKSEQNVPRRTNFDDAYGQSGSNPDSQRRVDYARASLKKHYEFLDKYAGQKVATVAPQNN
uniref:Uncharacterized protein n=1 Tax=Caenorhabditis japonica TaxID=281687 RepID=A0A8R1EMU7_CAEJA